ncbi:hypothetical protein FHR67_003819 [Xanthomonas arboricola]|nr:hypothetical protein [Xanthomonas campestris]
MPQRGQRPPALLLDLFVVAAVLCVLWPITDHQTLLDQLIKRLGQGWQLLHSAPAHAAQCTQPLAIGRGDFDLCIQMRRQRKATDAPTQTIASCDQLREIKHRSVAKFKK